MSERTLQDLKIKQALPLDVKILLTKARIREWINEYGEDGVYVSFSGGKDSTVLLDLVREDYPRVKGMFVDTGLEYPEIRDHVKTFENIDIVKPKHNFKQVIKKYGYPIFSKEISDTIDSSRKYLQKLEEKNSILTDRQTDRQTDNRLCPNGRSTRNRSKKRQEKPGLSSLKEGSLP